MAIILKSIPKLISYHALQPVSIPVLQITPNKNWRFRKREIYPIGKQSFSFGAVIARIFPYYRLYFSTKLKPRVKYSTGPKAFAF